MRLSSCLLVGCMAVVPLLAAPKSGTEPNASDVQFVKNAAEGGMAEVQMGKLAQDKGSNQAVKDFGQQMVTDHSKANEELKGVASSKNITVPEKLNAKDQALYDRLSKMSGAQFDREYMRAMVKDHETDIAEFKKASERVKDADIRGFASKTLPTLEHHLQMAKDANAKIGTTAGK